MPHTPWTRLEGTQLWRDAEAQYAANGHAYHDMAHVRRLYGHAAELRLPWDLSLDRGILSHDVILDGLPFPERRSAEWLTAHLGEEDQKAIELILTTEDHDLAHADRRLALLDLADFRHKEQRHINSHLLREEAERTARLAGRDFDEKAWGEGTLSWLNRLEARILEKVEEIPHARERAIWREIAKGVEDAMVLVQGKWVVPHRDRRDPAP